MTELKQFVSRCQRCGIKLSEHPQGCVPISRGSYDVSHEHLLEIDRMIGELLSEMLKLRSVDSVANSSFGEEFFALLDERRKG